jgi:NadR type nicotinamide-nucleotide adenylyltransferase
VSPVAPLRVVLIGPESTGKTILAERLAAHYEVPWSAEYAREHVEAHPGALGYADVDPIGRGQLANEDAARERAEEEGARLVFHDTDLVSTLVYSRHHYGDCPAWIEPEARSRLAELYLLHHTDVDWIPDGNQREAPERRDELFRLFRATLDDFAARITDIHGDWPDRERLARTAINALLDGGQV